MSAETKIEWTARPGPDGKLRPGMTFNGWIGCTKWGPECENCYALDLDARYQYGGATHFGKGVPRYLTSENNWQDPLRWNAKAKREGWRPAVFCSSLSDWADQEVDPLWQKQLLGLVKACPHLEWLMLTKRPENAAKLIEEHFPQGVPQWVRIGATVGSKAGLRRLPDLLKIDASLFLSVEPLLEPIDLYPHIVNTRIDQIIVGGESGPNAKPMNPAWAKSVQVDAWRAGIPFHFKQWGEWAPLEEITDPQARAMCKLGNVKSQDYPDGATVYRVGKHIAGRLFEGKIHDALPKEPIRLIFNACACNACTTTPRKKNS